MNKLSFGQVSGEARFPRGAIGKAVPLIVAVHGGSYDSSYFDLPGHSLLDRAEANGIPIIAIDRPGYGNTPLLARSEMTLERQGRFLTAALQELWDGHGHGRDGIVIIGHSIGAAISAYVASEPGTLPLLGLAISGVGMRTPAEHRPMWESLPDIDLVEMPARYLVDAVQGYVEGGGSEPGSGLEGRVLWTKLGRILGRADRDTQFRPYLADLLAFAETAPSPWREFRPPS